MKKLLFSLFTIFILLAYPLQAIEIDMSMSNDISKEISNELALPTIVGPDDREEIISDASQQVRAVVLIEATLDSTSWECSGAMVGPNVVLTAAHCISDDKGNPVTEIKVHAIGMPNPKLLPKADDEAGNNLKDHDPINKNILRNEILEEAKKTQFTYPFAKATQVWVPKRYKQGVIDNDSFKYWYDFGIIILDDNLGNKTGWLKVKDSNEELIGINIIVIGRGYDKPKYTLWKSPGQIGDKYDDFGHLFCHNADVLPGNSGGPVFKEDDPTNIIGLNNWSDKKEHITEGHPNCFLRINSFIPILISDRDKSWVQEDYLIFPQG